MTGTAVLQIFFISETPCDTDTVAAGIPGCLNIDLAVAYVYGLIYIRIQSISCKKRGVGWGNTFRSIF